MEDTRFMGLMQGGMDGRSTSGARTQQTPRVPAPLLPHRRSQDLWKVLSLSHSHRLAQFQTLGPTSSNWWGCAGAGEG